MFYLIKKVWAVLTQRFQKFLAELNIKKEFNLLEIILKEEFDLKKDLIINFANNGWIAIFSTNEGNVKILIKILI